MAVNTNLTEGKDFNAIRVGLASPDMIRSWSFGEVLKAETINYRSLKPEEMGLFCPRIFGPVKNYECQCGKYKHYRHRGKVCEKCGVEVANANVRRKRMGHIDLVSPVVHTWFFRARPSPVGILLGMSKAELDSLAKMDSYIVVKSGKSGIPAGTVLPESEYLDAKDDAGKKFLAKTGADAIASALSKIDLKKESKIIRRQLKTEKSKVRAQRLRQRLALLETFKKSDNKPEWMVMSAIPVLPPDLRPLVQLDGGKFSSSDLNDLYSRILVRNDRLKRLIHMEAPLEFLQTEKRMLQEAVDSLLVDGGSLRSPSSVRKKSLSESIKGKQGRFRQNLLGKRVDYSGRSVIVVGPNLKIHQCGLPKHMALELFKPFVIGKLRAHGLAMDTRDAKKQIERETAEVWDALAEVVEGHPVLLNRAPTLHRLGIQAFFPVLVEGKAIRLHPLVCKAFNADFDGDTMPVHVPLSKEAIEEAKNLMLSTDNVLSPANGKPVLSPSHDATLGLYYMAQARDGAKGEGMIFADEDEAVRAWECEEADIHAKVVIRMNGELRESTIGKIMLARMCPEGLESLDENAVNEYCRNSAPRDAANFADMIMSVGMRFSTLSGASIGVKDFSPPRNKNEIVVKAKQEAEELENNHMMGLISDQERYDKLISLWTNTMDETTAALMESMKEDPLNPVLMYMDSGARGSPAQMRQIAGMRGLMQRPDGTTMETPILSNFREGLPIADYFHSTHSARKGLADTALRTSVSGYLTRRLVDATQDCVVSETDCGSTNEERSPATCESRHGVCVECYGMDLAKNDKVKIGEAVGVVAAQSIGEPGTQLTMRTFHTGGAKSDSSEDIVGGMPTVEEIFEARRPVNPAIFAENDGVLSVAEEKRGRKRLIVTKGKTAAPATYPPWIPLDRVLLAHDGVKVKRGDILSKGKTNPHDVLRVFGIKALTDWIVQEVQTVYSNQGVSINDKHLHVVVRQMTRKAEVLDPGESKFMQGQRVEYAEALEVNNRLKAKGKKQIVFKRLLLGITRAALSTESFLAAASFQNTIRVLSDAAIAGKTDPLRGLKENIMTGRLIPAGSGLTHDEDEKMTETDEIEKKLKKALQGYV